MVSSLKHDCHSFCRGVHFCRQAAHPPASGCFHAAQTIGGVKYTASDVQYFYNSVYTSYANNYAFDSGTSVKKQVYDQETGQSWYDHLLEQAAQQLTESTAMAAKAEGEGYTLSQEAQEGLESTLNQLNSAWAGYG